MYDFQKTVNIEAPLARVWAVTIDIERWPEWTSTVTRAQRRGKGPVGLGSLVTIYQPKLAPALWKVTGLEPERLVVLQSGFPGLRVSAHHQMEARGAGTELTLGLRFEGWLGKWLGRKLADLNRNYLDIEAAGIKRFCEASPQARAEIGVP